MGNHTSTSPLVADDEEARGPQRVPPDAQKIRAMLEPLSEQDRGVAVEWVLNKVVKLREAMRTLMSVPPYPTREEQEKQLNPQGVTPAANAYPQAIPNYMKAGSRALPVQPGASPLGLPLNKEQCVAAQRLTDTVGTPDKPFDPVQGLYWRPDPSHEVAIEEFRKTQNFSSDGASIATSSFIRLL